MSMFTLLRRTLLFHWRANVAVLLGVIVGTAVLTGALLIGDSLRGSLRALTLDRLGRIDAALLSDRPFRAELATLLAKDDPDIALIAPALILRGAVLVRDDQGRVVRRVGRVQIVGVEPSFWPIFDAQRGDLEEAVLVNQPLATELDVKAGDRVEVRLEMPSSVPADSLLGRRVDDPSLTIEASPIVEVPPASGPGRFSLSANQQRPLILYVQLNRLQRRLRDSLQMPSPANALLVALKPDARTESLHARLRRAIDLEDLGLTLKPDASGKRYLSLESRRMLLESAVVDRVLRVAKEQGWEVKPTLTYLANLIADDRQLLHSVTSAALLNATDSMPWNLALLARACGGYLPYSAVTGLEPDAPSPWGPFKLIDGSPAPHLEDDEVLLTDWAARDLWPDGNWQTRVGRPVITLRYFVEGDGYLLKEESKTLKLAGVARLEAPALDRSLTPDFPGLKGTGIQDWKPPFPREQWHPEWVRERDEQFWRRHRAAPKAFVSPDTAQKLWQSRHGQYTSIRIGLPPPLRGRTGVGGTARPLDSATPPSQTSPVKGEGDVTVVGQSLLTALPPADLGLSFQPVKEQGLAAAGSSTAEMFGWLFLGFSFFLIISAAMLVALLFRLGIEQRARELGLLYAAGYRRRAVTFLLVSEGMLLALVGGLLGLVLAIAYAWLLIVYLQRSWSDTLHTSFLQLHVAAQEQMFGPLPYPSLVLGFVLGLGVALIAILWAVRGLSRLEPRDLLAGHTGSDTGLSQNPRAWFAWLTAGCLTLAVVLVGASFLVEGSAAPPLFFGSGAAFLVAGLGWLSMRLAKPGGQLTDAAGMAGLVGLGAGNARRQRGRSLLTIGLLASATFLIVAVESFRQSAATSQGDKNSGTGGFTLVAESDVPLQFVPSTPELRRALLPETGSDELKRLEERAGGSTIIGFRLRPGDDVSCLNLYQPLQPRIVGVSRAMIERGGFGCDAWNKLARDDGNDEIPVLADNHTAEWVLHKSVEDKWTITDEHGHTVTLHLVGLLQNSLFQSELLMGEDDFRRLFPSRGGYQFFLIDTPLAQVTAARQALESAFGESHGLNVSRTADRLASFQAVENTYLSTFQLLGGLGLLLGTLGLSIVLLRNVWERRGELALLRALGYSRKDLGWLVLAENVILVLLGLGLGVASALLAVTPHLLERIGSLPWFGILGLIVLVLVVGLLSGALALVFTLRTPLLPALRRE